MRPLIGLDNNILVRWTLLREGGKPFSVDQFALRLYINTPRGREEIKEFTITGEDNNIVCWEMNNGALRFLGHASLRMSILRQGQQVATVEEKNAFALSRRSPLGDCNTQTINVISYVSILRPELVPNIVSILFPTFEVDEDMHLWMHGTTDVSSHDFHLDADGHLYYDNNN